MSTPEERQDDVPRTRGESHSGGYGLAVIKVAAFRRFEQRGVIAALELVADLRRRRLPTLPNLRTPDPDNPTKKIEEANALVIGRRTTESPGRRGRVILIALFPETPPLVEFRSYGQVIPELVPGRTLLVPVGPLIEGHQLIFAKAEKSTQWELIKLALEAIYRQRAGEPPVLKS